MARRRMKVSKEQAPDLLTVTGVAKALGLHRNTILDAIYRGQLKAFWVGEFYVIPWEEARRWRQRIGKPLEQT